MQPPSNLDGTIALDTLPLAVTCANLPFGIMGVPDVGSYVVAQAAESERERPGVGGVASRLWREMQAQDGDTQA